MQTLQKRFNDSLSTMRDRPFFKNLLSNSVEDRRFTDNTALFAQISQDVWNDKIGSNDQRLQSPHTILGKNRQIILIRRRPPSSIKQRWELCRTGSNPRNSTFSLLKRPRLWHRENIGSLEYCNYLLDKTRQKKINRARYRALVGVWRSRERRWIPSMKLSQSPCYISFPDFRRNVILNKYLKI